MSPGQQQKAHQAKRQTALARFEAGDYVTAAPLLITLLARYPSDPSLLRCCGIALLRTSEAARGAQYLARARRLAPSDPVTALWHGIALQGAGQLVDAAEALGVAATLSPSDPAPLVHRSRVLLQAGRTVEALNAARAASALAPSLPEAKHVLRVAEVMQQSPPNAAAWSALADACLDLDRTDEARAALERACDLLPATAPEAVTLARVLHLCGRPLEALARLRTLLDLRPKNMVVRLALASCLMMHDEAAEALRLLDEIDGTADERWRAIRIGALLGLGMADKAEQALGCETGAANLAEILFVRHGLRLARMDGRHDAVPGLANWLGTLAMQRDKSWIEDRLDALFLLGDLHHGDNRPEAAFAHWQEGHRLLATAQPFERDTHRVLLDEIMQLHTRNGAVSGLQDETPVFIVGLPRTGTTLTEHILSAHRDVHGAGERLAIRDALYALTDTDVLAPALNRVAEMDARQLTEAATVFLAKLKALAPSRRYVLDKMPDNVLLLDFVARLLPAARVIVCTRDPRDVGFSIFRQRFLGYHPYAHDQSDLGWYISQHQSLVRHWAHVLPLRMLTLDHSEWITDFQATLNRVLHFLDLPHDPNCDRFYTQDRQIRTASRNQVNRPVNTDGVGVWKRYHRQLAPMLEQLAYGL